MIIISIVVWGFINRSVCTNTHRSEFIDCIDVNLNRFRKLLEFCLSQNVFITELNNVIYTVLKSFKKEKKYDQFDGECGDVWTCYKPLFVV